MTSAYSEFMFEVFPKDLLVGGAITILKNDGVRQRVSDDIPYNNEMENKSHV